MLLFCTGAHNCIVTSRAGKDLVSCLVSGLLTIGPRFGGAIDDAARYFQVRSLHDIADCLACMLTSCGTDKILSFALQDACDRGLDADDFVEDMKKKGIRVAGIGHRIKSKVRPDTSLDGRYLWHCATKCALLRRQLHYSLSVNAEMIL